MSAPTEIWVVVDVGGMPRNMCATEPQAEWRRKDRDNYDKADAPYTVHRYVLASPSSDAENEP